MTQNIETIMPIGFENADYVSTFRSLYSYLWDEL